MTQRPDYVSIFQKPFMPNSTYCQNCECNGCKIHRERIKLEEQARAEWSPHLCDYDDLPLNNKPGAIVPMYRAKKDRVEFGEETDEEMVTSVEPEKRRFIPWKALAYCAGIAICLQLLARVCGRVV